MESSIFIIKISDTSTGTCCLRSAWTTFAELKLQVWSISEKNTSQALDKNPYFCIYIHCTCTKWISKKSATRTEINEIIHKVSTCISSHLIVIHYLLVSHGKTKGTFNICIEHRSELVVLAVWYKANDVNLEKDTDKL